MYPRDEYTYTVRELRFFGVIFVEDLNLSFRESNALRRAGIRTTDALKQMTEQDLLYCWMIGPTVVDHIKAAMAEHGLHLRPTPEPTTN